MLEKSDIRKICVVGLGYIGLPTATVFASRKIIVRGVDVDSRIVDTVNRGEIHIIEPDLDILVSAVVSSGYLDANTMPCEADAFLLCVPTPFCEGKKPDLSYIHSACKSIAPYLKSGDLVILESTSPVGATEQMATWLSEYRSDLTFPQHVGELSDIRIAHCPERVLPGKVVHELVENDRIIGGMTPRCADSASALYKTFVVGNCVTTDLRTAELCKLTENSFRDVNIAFANELSMICHKLEVNVWELIRLANLHPRVNILQPGPGVGGHCIAVDPWFIVDSCQDEAKLIKVARERNDAKPDWVLKRVYDSVSVLNHKMGLAPEDVTIACFGITFKPDIDDIRESPAMGITQELVFNHPGKILVVEPNLRTLPDALLSKNVEFVDYEQACDRADLSVLLVDHSIFRNQPEPLKKAGQVIDTRGLTEL